jgi:hypothetical protein
LVPTFSARGEPPISMPHSTNRFNSGVHGILPADCQMPEKSGLPSAGRGGGAVRSGLPSGDLGDVWRRVVQPLAGHHSGRTDPDDE